MFLLQRRRPQGWAGDRLARVAHLQDDRDVKAIIPIAVTADVCDRTLTDHLRELLFAGWLGQETDATFHPPSCLVFGIQNPINGVLRHVLDGVRRRRVRCPTSIGKHLGHLTNVLDDGAVVVLNASWLSLFLLLFLFLFPLLFPRLDDAVVRWFHCRVVKQIRNAFPVFYVAHDRAVESREIQKGLHEGKRFAIRIVPPRLPTQVAIFKGLVARHMLSVPTVAAQHFFQLLTRMVFDVSFVGPLPEHVVFDVELAQEKHEEAFTTPWPEERAAVQFRARSCFAFDLVVQRFHEPCDARWQLPPKANHVQLVDAVEDAEVAV